MTLCRNTDLSKRSNSKNHHDFMAVWHRGSVRAPNLAALGLNLGTLETLLSHCSGYLLKPLNFEFGYASGIEGV